MLDTKQFEQEALRTESSEFHLAITEDDTLYSHERLIHAAFGMQTESAEFTDALKKTLFYGKPLDVVNLREELGDLLWYMALASNELGTSLAAEADRVIRKLKVRYPEKFTQTAAEVRDLTAEREELEH